MAKGASHDQIKITDMYKPNISMFQRDLDLEKDKSSLMGVNISKLKNFNEFKNHQKNLLL